MKSFFKKMYIFLFEPRKIGVFLGEKMFKAFLRLFILTLIAISPSLIKSLVQSEITQTSNDKIVDILMVQSENTDFMIKNNSFSGTDWEGFIIEEGIIILNPNNLTISLDSQYLIYHIVELTKEGINVIFLNETIYSKSYQELGVSEIDFSKIEKADYIELDKFLELVNIAFNEFKISLAIENLIYNFIFVYFNLILSALVLAFIIKIVNPMVVFKYRFKCALDCQIISVLATFLTMLFNLEFISYIGVILSAVYLFIAMAAIVRIEVQRNSFRNDDKEE